MKTNFRADEAGGTGDEEFFHRSMELGAWGLESEGFFQ